MQLYYYDRTIEAAPEAIFKVVNVDEKLKEWSPIFKENEYFTDETRSSGTKFRTRMKVLNRTYQFRSAITQYEAARFIEVHTYLRQGASFLPSAWCRKRGVWQGCRRKAALMGKTEDTP